MVEAREAKLTAHGKMVLEKRYLKKDDNGKPVETAEELFFRVAKHIASADLMYDTKANIDKITQDFYDIMSNLAFLPNSPTLMNAGRELGQLSACFVLPIEDSIDSIFEALKYTALIHKSGGGTGFSFSRLRPKNDLVKSTSGISSGPVSFMQVFNAATEAIKQGGTRRGANMGILRIDHPDIMDFVTCKNENESLNNFNISVGITDEFMDAVENDWEYPLRNPRTKEALKKISAKTVFNKIVDQAWKNGEPGVVFLDRLNEFNPTPESGEIESTNPCGEQPLLPYESCNLGSINVSRIIKKHDNKKEVDWEKLDYVTRLAVHFLDNVIDMNKFPIDKIEQQTKKNRKIGLGIMGWADLLIQLGLPYNSKESYKMADKIMSFIHKVAKEKTIELANKRGPFPGFSHSIFKDGPQVRNATLTTIAPTGTIGIIAGASSGIEPLFALVYTRANVLDNQKMFEVNPYFEQLAKEHGFYSDELIEKISQTGTIKNMKEIPDSIRRIFVTAQDILPEDHIRIQAVFQKYTDNAVSKTVNFSQYASREDIAKVYMLAYHSGCKGVTVYRDKSRDVLVLNIGNGKEKRRGDVDSKPRVRPQMTQGITLRLNTGCGRMYVTLNRDEHGLCELFTQLGKSGGCIASQSEAVARLVSLALRSGISAEEVVSQLKGIRCPTPMMMNGNTVLSCADGIARAMETYIKESNIPDLFFQNKETNGNGNGNGKDTAVVSIQQVNGMESAVSMPLQQSIAENGHKYDSSYKSNISGVCPECPECGQMLVYSEGCAMCNSCGYSRCW